MPIFYQRKRMDDGEWSKHRRALETIAANPSLFGFNEIKSVALELTIRDKSGIAVAEPDIQLAILNGGLHLVEFKNRRTPNSLKTARRQLRKAKEWYVKRGSDPKRVYTHIMFGDDPKYKDLLKGS